MSKIADKTPTPEVLAIGKIPFEGNVIPKTWYTYLVNEAGKVNLPAVVVLAEICYWYRPTVNRDEYTGELLKAEKKFSADKLQRSYSSFESIGLTKRQAQDACRFLQSKGLIEIELRTIETKNHGKLPNVVFIGINPEAIADITLSHLNEVSLKNVRRITKKRETYHEKTGDITETTTETTTVEDAKNSEIEELETFGNVREVINVPKVGEPTYDQGAIVKLKKDSNSGFTIPIDFKLNSDIIEDATNAGYAGEDITDEFIRFEHYYRNGKGKTLKETNWYHKFVNEWLNSSYKYGTIKRNGKFYRDKPDANQERITAIKKLTDPNNFSHITD